MGDVPIDNRGSTACSSYRLNLRSCDRAAAHSHLGVGRLYCRLDSSALQGDLSTVAECRLMSDYDAHVQMLQYTWRTSLRRHSSWAVASCMLLGTPCMLRPAAATEAAFSTAAERSERRC